MGIGPNLVDGGSNPGLFGEKSLPYRLSHRGIVIELNLKLGATHISVARFLVAPNSVWKPLSISRCVCVCVCARHCVQKFGKIHGELNSRCLNQRPIHYQMSHSGLSIWVIILPNKCSKCTWKLLQKFDLSWDRTRAVTHPSTNLAKYCLTSVIRPELVLSTWYGCTHVFYFVFCNIKVIHELLNLHAKS